ncbi:MAG: DUF4136 domain-containing protein [Myxococcota bacterium]|nr:DUF4136 domain-containing protein [Myxococcota bacterium]
MVVLLMCCLYGELGCSNIKSDSDYDPNVDFSGLKTYAWLPNQPQGQTKVLHTNGLRLDRVRNAIDKALSAKGLNPVEEAEADFLIRSLVTEEIIPSTTPTGHSDELEAQPKDAVPPQTRRTQRYENVALIVDFLAPPDQSLIWRGTGEKRIERNTTAKIRESSIVELVNQILSRYPPETS